METEKVIEALEKAMQKVMPIGQSAFEELVAKTAFEGALYFGVCVFVFISSLVCGVIWVAHFMMKEEPEGAISAGSLAIFMIPAFVEGWKFLVQWLYPKAHVIEQIINRVQ